MVLNFKKSETRNACSCSVSPTPDSMVTNIEWLEHREVRVNTYRMTQMGEGMKKLWDMRSLQAQSRGPEHWINTASFQHQMSEVENHLHGLFPVGP